MIITALILTYYPERVKNVKRIIDDLKISTRPPDNIIIFSNNHLNHISSEGVTVVTSTKNFSTRAKYIACLLEPSDYYILIDDDVTVGKKTIEHWLQSIPSDVDSFCTAQEGFLLNGKPLSERTQVLERDINKPIRADGLVGSIVFCSFTALLKMLIVEPAIRLQGKYKYEGDDILMGLANTPITIFPVKEDEASVNLDQQNIWFAKVYGNYGDMRDEFTRKVLTIL